MIPREWADAIRARATDFSESKRSTCSTLGPKPLIDRSATLDPGDRMRSSAIRREPRD